MTTSSRNRKRAIDGNDGALIFFDDLDNAPTGTRADHSAIVPWISTPETMRHDRDLSPN